MSKVKVADPLKRKLLNQVKKKDFYQQLLRDNVTLETALDASRELLDANKELLDYFWFVKPGHFYSPLINDGENSFDHLTKLEDEKQKEVELPGIKLNKKEQLDLFTKLEENFPELKAYTTDDAIRFRFDNDQFGMVDMSFLFLMLRHFKPKRVIEVGSGWTSALMLDLNDRFPKNSAELTFIEPYPERLYGALKKSDKKHCKVIEKKVQSVDPAVFMKLQAGDVLFIDNSHVSKCSSDVNYLLFEILPRLNDGVIVHIHDVFYPFEYPYEWVVSEKRNWNEAYVVRALLTGSDEFNILMWPSYLTSFNRKRVQEAVPVITGGIGASLWLKKSSKT